MRIAYISCGAAGRYCGNCLRDHALAAGLVALGEDVLLVPTYTPLRTDLPLDGAAGPSPRLAKLFFNGVHVYLAQESGYFRRRRRFLEWILGSRPFLSLLSRFPASTAPASLGPLTQSMLEGEAGNQAQDLDELVRWLAAEARPDVIHLSNVLLLGMARRLRHATGVPIFVTLQSEDAFIEGLAEPYRQRCLGLIAERAGDVERFVAVSSYYAEHAAATFGLRRQQISVVLSGIPLVGHAPRVPRTGAPLAVGYLARLAPEKGLHLLCQAFTGLAREPLLEGLCLRAAGYLGSADFPYAARLRRGLASAGLREQVDFLGTVDREEKLAFLDRVDVLAVPTVYREPKGLFALEALASGVPVVAPDHGAFPELAELTGGIVLHRPGDVGELQRALRELLLDPARRRELGERGRERVHEHFGSERMARETLALYREALSARASAAGAARLP